MSSGPPSRGSCPESRANNELGRHDNPTIRGDAAFVLGIIGDGEAKQALQESLKDRHAGVREAAREALEEIG